MDEKIDSGSKSDESLIQCANEAVVTLGRFLVNEADCNMFHATFGHAHGSLLKATTRSMGITHRHARRMRRLHAGER